jgi:hypothetical protein
MSLHELRCERDAALTSAHSLCYDLTADIAAYLNRKDVRELLGAAPEAGDFQTCNMDVRAASQACSCAALTPLTGRGWL